MCALRDRRGITPQLVAFSTGKRRTELNGARAVRSSGASFDEEEITLPDGRRLPQERSLERSRCRERPREKALRRIGIVTAANNGARAFQRTSFSRRC